jgi:hypothetical protein
MLNATSGSQLEEKINALASQYRILNVSHSSHTGGFTAAVTVEEKSKQLLEG